MKILFGSPYHEPFDNGRLMADAIRRARPGIEVVHWDVRNQREVPPAGRGADATIIVKMLGDHREFRKLPGYRICIFPDALDRFPGMHKALQDYDRVLSCNDPGPYTWAEWFPLGYSERLALSPVLSDLPRPHPALFVGTNNSPERLRTVKQLRHLFGDRLGLYGNGWPTDLRPKPAIYFGDYVGLLRRAQAVINMHESPVGPNLKVFEIPPCAPMLLLGGARGLDRIFDRHLLGRCFAATPEFALHLIAKWLEDPALAEKVRREQFEAIKPYSYEQQMAKLMEGLAR